MSARSYLYVPADRPDRLAKAPGRGADALIVDLEDGVAPADKDAARANAAAFLADASGAEVWVRVNADELQIPDVRAVVGPNLAGLVVPKLSSMLMLELLETELDALEPAAALPARSIALAPLIESGAAVLAAPKLAHARRVARLAMGEADLCADLGVTPSAGEPELAPIRMQIVVASAAAGIDPPTGPVSTDFRDLDAYRAGTQALKRMGFGSRSAIHPAQVEIVNEVFTPSADELARARRLVELSDAAGGGVCVDDEGRMVDEAVVRSARRTIATANG
jgi:citrate lyase subunit beta/citryl-CoA lyase